MRTIEELEQRLNQRKEELEATQVRFSRYENVEDLNAVPALNAEIATLEWLLGARG